MNYALQKFMIEANRLVVVALLGGVCLYIVYLLYHLLKPGRSSHEQEIDRILSSDKYKVKGKFEQ